MLAICGITDEDTIEKAGGAVLVAVKVYQANKLMLRQLDKNITGGIVGSTLSGESLAVWAVVQ